jgi:uncharacterized protein (DUF433 family)
VVTAEQKARLDEAVWVSPQRVSGTPCFRGTRVPVQSLIDFLEGGETIDQFLALYPGITRQQAVAALLEEFWSTHSVTRGKTNWTRDKLYKRR